MKELEVVTGFALLLSGAVPVGSVLLSGKLPQPTTSGPAGLTGEDEGKGSRVEAQFYHFWFMISFFFFGIGAWFVIAGLNDKDIISSTRTKPQPGE